ncbi:hypothetical protein, partial [Klebsiella pneumoniae]
NGGKNSLNRLIRCVCGKKIGPDPRNFNQRVSLGRNDLLIRTFLSIMSEAEEKRLNKDKIMMLSSVVADLAELAIATNKIANSATYSSGYKDAKNV